MGTNIITAIAIASSMMVVHRAAGREREIYTANYQKLALRQYFCDLDKQALFIEED